MTGFPPLLKSRTESQIPDSLFEKAIKVANLPAETIARVVGSTLTDNPKYRGMPLSTNAFQQPGFSDLFIDAGVPVGVAAALDFVVNIANPLDPLNKVGFGVTKVGRVGAAAEEAMRYGRIVDKYVNAKTFKVLTKEQAAAVLAKHGTYEAAKNAGELALVKQIGLFGSLAERGGKQTLTGPLQALRDAKVRAKAAESAHAAAVASKDQKAIRDATLVNSTAQKNLQLAQRNLDNVRQTNSLLAQLQVKNGMSFDRIIDLPSKLTQLSELKRLRAEGRDLPAVNFSFERGKNVAPFSMQLKTAEDIRQAENALRVEEFRRGNRVLAGLQNFDPRRLPAMPFRKQALLEEAPRAPIGSKFGEFSSAVQAKLAGLSMGVTQTLGGFARSQAVALAERMGFATLKTEQQRELYQQLHLVLGSTKVDAEHFALEAANLRLRNQNLSRQDFEKVVDALENRFPTKRAETQVLREYLGSKPMDEIDKLIKSRTKAVPREGTVAARSDAEALMLQPDALDATDVQRASALWTTETTDPIILSGGHALRINDDFVTIKLHEPAEDINQLRKRYERKSILTNSGIVPMWRVAQQEDGSMLLVARKMPGGTIAFPSIVDGTHLENLSRGAAYLSRGSVYVPPIRATKDIGFGATAMVSPGGGIHILDPEMFSAVGNKARGVRRSEARLMSETVLRKMAEDFDIGNPLLMDFPALRSDLSASLQHSGTRYFAMRNTADLEKRFGIAEDSLGVIGVRDLLDTAGNTGPIRDMIRGVTLHGMTEEQAAVAFGHARALEHANGILQERARLRDLKITDPLAIPDVHPIVYTTTPTGQVFIVDGLDRLGAAALEGFQSVPIIRKPYLAEVSDATGIWTRPFAVSLKTASEIHPSPAAASRILGNSHILAPYVDRSYRFLKNGKAVTLPEILASDANAIESSTHGKMRDVLSHDPASTSRLNSERARVFDQFFDGVYEGDRQAATVALASIVSKSPDVETFIKNLREHFNGQFNKRLPIGWDSANKRGILSIKQQQFAEAKDAAERYLNALGKYGIFVESPGKLARMWEATRNSGGTIIAWDQREGRLVVMGAHQSADELEKLTKEYLAKSVDAKGIVHNDRILIAGGDRQSQILVSDLITGEHPRTIQSVPRPAQFQFSEKVRKELQQRGIYINPVFGSIRDAQGQAVYNAAIKRFTDDKTAVYFFTRNGELVLRVGNDSPSAQSVEALAHGLMGEATDAIAMQEWGFVTNGKLVINNPLGSAMPIVNKANVALLEERIRHVAKKFRAAGLGNIEVEIASAFRDDAWKKMLLHDKRRLTLDHLVSNEFKLVIPPELNNVVVDSTLRTSQSITQIVRPVLPEGGAQEIFKWAKNNLDEAARMDVMNSLPLKDWASYFPRIQTREARDALNAVFDTARTKNKQLEHVWGSHASLKGRKFTDLTLREINDIFTKANFDMAKLMEHASTREQAAWLRALSEGVPGGLKFFHDDPILAVTMRKMRSYQAQAELGIIRRLESMHDSGVLYSGTLDDIGKLRGDSVDIAAGEKAVAERTITRKQLEGELNNAKARGAAATVIGDIEKKIQEAEKSLDEALQHYNTVLRASRKKLGIHSVNQLGERVDSVWLRGNDARELLESGAVAESSFLDSVHSPMVRVKYDVIRQIEKARGIRAMVVTPETESVLAKLFDLRLNKKGEGSKLLRLYDQFNTLFKRWTLFPVPGFHTRNLVSNMVLAWMGGVTDAESYAASFQTFRVLADVNPSIAPMLRSVPGYRPSGVHGLTPGLSYQEGIETLQRMNVFDISGNSTTMHDMWNEFVKQGGLQGGLVVNEFNGVVSKFGVDTDILRIGAKHGLVPSSELASGFIERASNVAPVRGGAKLAAMQENFFRFATFYDTWRRTGSFEQATLNMKKIFYDYEDLSQFEKVILKRAIPFYSWMRFNTPRMLETIFTNPVAHLRMRNFFTAIENEVMDSPEERDMLPQFINDRFGIIIGRDKQTGRYDILAGDSAFPMFDAYRFIRGLQSGDPFSGVIEYGAQAVSPLLKLPFEQLMNKSLFTGRELQRVPGELSRSGTLSMLGMTKASTLEGPLGFVNVLWNEKNVMDLFRVGDQMVKVWDTIVGDANRRGETNHDMITTSIELLLGRLYQISPEETAYWALRDWKASYGTLASLKKRAYRDGNQAAALYYGTRMLQLELLRGTNE